MLVTGYIVNERNKVEELIDRYNDALRALNAFDAAIDVKQGKKSLFKTSVSVKEGKETK